MILSILSSSPACSAHVFLPDFPLRCHLTIGLTRRFLRRCRLPNLWRNAFEHSWVVLVRISFPPNFIRVFG